MSLPPAPRAAYARAAGTPSLTSKCRNALVVCAATKKTIALCFCSQRELPPGLKHPASLATVVKLI